MQKKKKHKKDPFDEIVEDLTRYDEGYTPRKMNEIDE